jgi:hypothetical protein
MPLVMRTTLIAVLITLSATAVFGQQRPLVTEDPETVGAGRVLVEGGLDYGTDVVYPASGLEGRLLRFPLIGFSVGVSSIAEIQIDGGLYNRLSITSRRPAPLANVVTALGSTTSDVEDIVIGAKVRIAAEGTRRPAFGFRFATKLPNAGNESGLGLDTTDFVASVLVGKTTRSIRIVGNIGLAILGDPTVGDRQNDELAYGLSFARALTNAAEVVGEVNGRINSRNGQPPPGTESRGVFRFGGRYTVGSWRADAAVMLGMTNIDAGVGVAAGFTYVFDAFTVP